MESFLSSTKALGGLCTAKEDVMKKLVMDGDTYGYFILYIIIVYCYLVYEYVYTHTVSYLIPEPFWIVIFYDDVAKKVV